MAKILVIANILVPPIIAGSSKCIDAYITLLREMEHEVYFLYSGRETNEKIEAAKRYWGKNFLYYKYSQIIRVANWIKRNVVKVITGGYSIDYYYPVYGLVSFINRAQKKHHFDALIINYMWMTKLANRVNIPHKLLFTHDSFTNKRERIHEDMYSLSPIQEAKGLNRVDTILSIQEDESIVFRYLAPSIPVYTVFMPIQFKVSTISDNKNILFFSGDSEINRNGISYFINEVWPLVIKQEPEAKLLVAGSICKNLYIEDSSIRIIGFIDDADTFYNQGSIAINPVYQGTGLKIKTLEALSYGKVTVVHPHSVEGLYRKTDSPVFVANTTQEYAELIVNTLQGKIDKSKHQEICRNYIQEMNDYIKKQYNSINFK